MGCCQAKENIDGNKVPVAKLALLSNDTSTDVYDGALRSESILHQNEDTMRKETDRFKNRSKYTRNKNLSTDKYEVNEQEVESKRCNKMQKHLECIREIREQKQVREYEQKNDVILDKAIMTTLETQVIAADTAQVLDGQRYQLIQIDKELHHIDGDLNRTQKILKGMTTWSGFMKRTVFKLKKAPPQTEYVPPISKETAMERNIELSYGMQQDMSDNPQDMKLNALLKNVKVLNHTANDITQELQEHDAILGTINNKMDDMAPRIQKQVKTIHKYNKKH